MEAIERIHETLMAQSNLYRYAYENKLAWLVTRLQLRYLEDPEYGKTKN
jgi:hypothetical protein